MMHTDNLKAIKDSIVIIVAGNEQSNWHIIKRLNEKGVKFMAVAMKYCDYSFFIPANEELGINDSILFTDKVAIERKQHLSELAGNFMKGRIRFDAEFTKAKIDDCKAILLIEDEKGRDKIKLRQTLDKDPCKDWDFIFRKTWRSKFCANSMIASIKAFKERYSLDVIFCKKTETADKMLEIFYKAIDAYFNNKEC